MCQQHGLIDPEHKAAIRLPLRENAQQAFLVLSNVTGNTSIRHIACDDAVLIKGMVSLECNGNNNNTVCMWI